MPLLAAGSGVLIAMRVQESGEPTHQIESLKAPFCGALASEKVIVISSIKKRPFEASLYDKDSPPGFILIVRHGKHRSELSEGNSAKASVLRIGSHIVPLATLALIEHVHSREQSLKFKLLRLVRKKIQ